MYREGLQYVESMPAERLPTVALAYLQQEQRVRALAHQVSASSLASKGDIEELLLSGGVRAAVDRVSSS